MAGPNVLPADLPVPEDDGAADHLPGLALPAIELASTAGGRVRLDALGRGRPRTVLYVYPMTGRPGADLPEGWDSIPGARGCTPEACAFRNELQAPARLGCRCSRCPPGRRLSSFTATTPTKS